MVDSQKPPGSHPPAAPDPEILAKAEADVAQARKDLAWEMSKAAVDIAGIADPTPISDAIGMSMSLVDGDYVGAGLSLLSMVPYLGDALGKTAKGAKALKAIKAAEATLAAKALRLEAVKNAGNAAQQAKKALYLGKARLSAKTHALLKCPKMAPAIDKLAQMAGVNRVVAARLIDLAEKHKVKIRLRPTNPDAKKWIKAGYPPKPQFLKNNTINAADEAIGAPRGVRGQVGFFEPKPPDPGLLKSNKELYEEAQARYQVRKKDWDDELRDGHIAKLKQEGVVEVKNGVIVQKSSGKPYTGDIDLYEIRNADGTAMSEAKRRKVLKDLAKEPVGARHPDHVNWKTQNPKEAEIKARIINKHADKGDVAEVSPTGVGTYTPDQVPVPETELVK